MTPGRHRAAVIGIWVLVAAIAILDVAVWFSGGMPVQPSTILTGLITWVLLAVLGLLASRGLGRLNEALDRIEGAHRSSSHDLEQLQVRNEMLRVLAQSVDLPLAFLTLARGISRLVPCDRMGLAVLTDLDGQDFQTYTARVTEEERRTRPRPEVVFKADRSAIGAVVRSRTAMVIPDTAVVAAEYLDVNVLHSSGFASAAVLPLISEGRAVGTLNLVSRSPNAFRPEHVETLKPVTEMFAVAFIAQQLQARATRLRTMETVREQAASVIADITGGIRGIIGHCEVIQTARPEPATIRELERVVAQSERILGLLERLRGLTNGDRPGA